VPRARALRLLHLLRGRGWGATLEGQLRAMEGDAYRVALERAGGNITQAAQELGVSRVTASTAVKRLGLRAWLNDAHRYRDPATVGRRGESRRHLTSG